MLADIPRHGIYFGKVNKYVPPEENQDQQSEPPAALYIQLPLPVPYRNVRKTTEYEIA
jgi:hypothetical protein